MGSVHFVIRDSISGNTQVRTTWEIVLNMNRSSGISIYEHRVLGAKTQPQSKASQLFLFPTSFVRSIVAFDGMKHCSAALNREEPFFDFM